VKFSLRLVLAATFAGAACAHMYPRYGLQHYLGRLVAPDAVSCGLYRRLGYGVDEMWLTREESTAVASCMTAAVRARRRAFFHVAGSRFDSRWAWGLVATEFGHLKRFDYDSAPCGGPGCPEHFETLDCPLPPEGVVDPSACGGNQRHPNVPPPNNKMQQTRHG
jgi:hypothetical protein